MQILLLTVSSILVVIGPVTYIFSILRGITRPHRMTRFILLFVLSLNFISIIAARGNLGAITFAGITWGQAVIIFLLSIWRGMGGSSKFDFICFFVAALGVIGWKLTGNPLLAIYFSIIADLSAYFPAFVKTWRHPKTESPWYYLLSSLAAFFSLVAYKVESASIFQIYIMVSCFIMIGLIYRKSILRLR